MQCTYLHTHADYGTIHNSSVVKVSLGTLTYGEENVVYIHNEVIFGGKEE